MERFAVKEKVVTETTVALLLQYLLVALHSVLKLQLITKQLHKQKVESD